ncbi:MAG: hypothetical protein DWI62_02355 [Chloroflexi bacterium]|nr:MAG: hypothetical protein DWI62_02355 [Chloroflexota bacterium]
MAAAALQSGAALRDRLPASAWAVGPAAGQLPMEAQPAAFNIIPLAFPDTVSRHQASRRHTRVSSAILKTSCQALNRVLKWRG